jgi:sugar phosphate isomerase/epimerase
MKIGASIWPWKWSAPYEDTIVRIAKAGFKAIELIAWDRQTLDEYYTPQKIKELRKLLADQGLELSEFVSTPRGLSNPDKKDRDASVDYFKRMVEVSVELGTKIVNSVSVHPFGLDFPRITALPASQEFRANLPSGLDWKKNYDDYVESMKKCCAFCEKASLKYALEPHPYRWMSNAAGMLRLIEHVGSPALGMNLDPSHLFPVGELSEAVVYQLRDRIFHCHFSDNDGVTNTHWRVGRGKIHWTGVMQALKDVGFNGVISIELEDAPGGRDEHIPGPKRPAATEEFDVENIAAMNYIKDICKQLKIKVD